MKFNYYYWFLRKAEKLGQAEETALFLNRKSLEEFFIARIREAGYFGNVPPIHYEREPEEVFESVLLCQFIFESSYYEIRAIAIDNA